MRARSIQDFDEIYLKMLKEFTIKAIETGQRNKNESEDFGIPIFYALILDSSPVNFCDLAIENLCEILKQTQSRDKLWQVLLKCMDNISQGHSAYQSLKLAIRILEGLCTYKSSASMKDDNLKILDEKVGGLIPLVVQNLQNYIYHARTESAKHQEPYKSVLQGRYRHSKNIKKRLEFIEYVLSSRSFAFSREHFAVIWEIFVKQPVTLNDEICFFK